MIHTDDETTKEPTMDTTPRHWTPTGETHTEPCGCTYAQHIETGTRDYHEQWIPATTCPAHTPATVPATVGMTLANGETITRIVYLDTIGGTGYYIHVDKPIAPIFVGWMAPTVTNGVLDRDFSSDYRNEQTLDHHRATYRKIRDR